MNRFFLLTLAAGALTTQGTAAEKNPVVQVETSLGSFKVELYADKAPISVKNFLQYVDEKFYDGTIFHRVIPDFMVQGGGFVPDGQDMKEKKTHDPIKNESDNGVSNDRGTLAMARTNVPDSATSQFYINLKPNEFLNKASARDRVGYCVFGKVTEGMDTIDKIAQATTGKRRQSGDRPNVHDNVPTEDVTIKSIRRMEK
jgi:cyclophilin family peptidyl-prolyl cis-trans isomerase